MPEIEGGASMIHIVHLVTSFDTGGLQNGIVNIINGANGSNFRHTVLSMRNRLGLAERLNYGDVLSLDFAEGRHPAAYKLIAESLKKLSPDILHTRNWGTYPDGILAARKAGVDKRVHGYHGRDLANADGEKMRRRLMGKMFSLMTDKIIALTATMKTEYSREFFVAEDKITVIHNGIDLSRMDQFAAADEFGSGFKLATVGRLDAVKNIDLLIRSFLGMKNRSAEDRLVIAGDGPEREHLEALGKELGLNDQVLFLGQFTVITFLCFSKSI